MTHGKIVNVVITVSIMQLSLFEENQQLDCKNPLGYLENREKPDKNSPIVVSFGGGTNSTAMLIAMVYKRIKPDLILFADTGGELPETYQWIVKFSEWLEKQGFPAITTVKKSYTLPSRIRASLLIKWKPNYINLDWFFLSVYLGLLSNGNQLLGYGNLYDKCVVLRTLPSRTFNRGECSVTWKIEPQNHFTEQLYSGILGTTKIRKFIGYHAGEIHRLINKKSNPFDDEYYRYEYPLIEWKMTQQNCIALIESLGLGIPPKSSCFFCPNRKKNEVERLKAEYPDLYDAACFLESNFLQREYGYVGLGRNWKWSEIDALSPLESALIDTRQSPQSCSCID